MAEAEPNAPYAFAQRAHLRALGASDLTFVPDDSGYIEPRVYFEGDHIDGSVSAVCALCRQVVASSAWISTALTIEFVVNVWAAHTFYAARDEAAAAKAAHRDAELGPFIGPLEREHLDAARAVLTFEGSTAIVRDGCAMIAVFVGDTQVGEVYVPTTDDAPEAAYRLFEAVRQRVAMEVTRG